MISLVFVYGTLMTTARGEGLGHDERQRLRREATFVGPATLSAQLFDLGDYPGILLSDDPGAVVHGEVHRLADPARSLAWLDVYEGVTPHRAPHEEYRREIVRVTMAAGGTVDAWAYVLAGPRRAMRLIPGGRWLGRG